MRDDPLLWEILVYSWMNNTTLQTTTITFSPCDYCSQRRRRRRRRRFSDFVVNLKTVKKKANRVRFTAGDFQINNYSPTNRLVAYKKNWKFFEKWKIFKMEFHAMRPVNSLFLLFLFYFHTIPPTPPLHRWISNVRSISSVSVTARRSAGATPTVWQEAQAFAHTTF